MFFSKTFFVLLSLVEKKINFIFKLFEECIFMCHILYFANFRKSVDSMLIWSFFVVSGD